MATSQSDLNLQHLSYEDIPPDSLNKTLFHTFPHIIYGFSTYMNKDILTVNTDDTSFNGKKTGIYKLLHLLNPN